tara:strand:- start:283 stop:756 length:474 start_codon:yes stop_codon:yes gene_type:complete
MARSSFRSQGTANSNALDIFGNRKEPEDYLWVAVLAKAIDDAIYSSDYGEAMNSINWIEGGGRDYRFVCHLAGRSPEYIQRRIKDKLKERREIIAEFYEGIKQRIEEGMKYKSAVLAAKSKNIGGVKGRLHKGGYHSGKRWRRKWAEITNARDKTLQ